MKAIYDRALAILFAVFTNACFAQTMDESASTAPAPTVSVVWVLVFLLIFVVICVWIGVAIWRNERKNRASNQENAQH